MYCLKFKDKYCFVLDKIAIATPIVGTFIRLGNLMNSEIIGKASGVPWAFFFERVDNSPRHPAQLYEAIILAIIVFSYVLGYLFDVYKR
jgi:prolipoprotein diacylglyceryltransferase